MEVINPIKYACFELTNYCNLDCAFCNRMEVIKGGMPMRHMNESSLTKILENLKQGGHKLEDIKYTGLGEPFLHPKFDIMLKLMSSYYPKANHVVATNCQYRLDSKLGEVFKKSLPYITDMYFSIDGYKESYERDRRKSSWKKLIKFLDDFSTLDRHNCKVSINYVVNTDNVYDIPKIEELRKHYNLEELRLNLAQCWDVEGSIDDGYSKEQIDYLKTNWLPNIKGKAPWSYNDCFWPTKGLYVNVLGDVKGCIIKTDSKSFGNLITSNMEEIRSTDRWEDIVKGCATNCPTDHCKNCSYKELSPLLEQIGINNA